MTKKQRKRYSAEEKFGIVRQVLSRSKTVTEICQEHGIHPNMYYRWQNDFFEGALAFFQEKSQGRTKAAVDREKDRMASEISRMKEVIAEVVTENIDLKKKNMG